MSSLDQDIKDESKRKVNTSIVKVSVKEAAAKMSTKHEIYNFLIFDCKRYLCDEDCLTSYFMKDIMQGKRKGKYSYY